MKVRLDHVVIAVSDWERSNAFYREVLGAELVELSPGRWAYRFGDQQPGARDGGRSVYFCDPDGSLLELISYA